MTNAGYGCGLSTLVAVVVIVRFSALGPFLASSQLAYAISAQQVPWPAGLTALAFAKLAHPTSTAGDPLRPRVRLRRIGVPHQVGGPHLRGFRGPNA